MPRLSATLTDLRIRRAQPAGKPYFLPDGNGLVLWVSPAGLKAWRVRYRLPDGSRPAPATIGHYPDVSLSEARIKAIEIQRAAKQGRATAGIRKAKQEAKAAVGAEQEAEAQERAGIEHASLRAVSGRWMVEKRVTWALETYRKARLVVESYLVPKIGDLDVRVMETKDVRPLLVEMAKETPQLARKARQYVASIVERAIDEVARGGTVVTLALAGLAEAVRDHGGMRRLTPRQREILAARARGESFRSIGQRLFISERTAQDHMNHVNEAFADYLATHSPADLERDLGIGPGDLNNL